MDQKSIFEQAVNTSKAHGYDILANDIEKLKEDNEKLLIKNRSLEMDYIILEDTNTKLLQDKTELLDMLKKAQSKFNELMSNNKWTMAGLPSLWDIYQESTAAIEKHSL